MFGFNKAKINTQALALVLQKGSKNVYGIKDVDSQSIVISGKYRDRQRDHRILYVSFDKNKAYFKDALGNLITHIKQGVESSEIQVSLNEIFNIVQ